MKKMEIEIQGGVKPRELEAKDQKWVYDSSVDHKGNVPLRASTGAWKASLFIIGKEYTHTHTHVVWLVAEKEHRKVYYGFSIHPCSGELVN